MKILKFITALALILTVACAAFPTALAESAPESRAAIGEDNGEYVPLFTTSPDSTLKEHPAASAEVADPPLFYTHTTFLALFAGYLILFKVKGIPHGEKMHRRRR